MCTYLTHLRVCRSCGGEDTVLISEQLCAVAEVSGLFGSCLGGVFSQHDRTPFKCWKCRDATVAVSVKMLAAMGGHTHGGHGGGGGGSSAAGGGRRSSGHGHGRVRW
ncbi:hypothetical protein B0H66DRAFT_177707 [Apodospora peruviana]|uniref:Uncharacterized protein n=1 Tax=Apodospora peruviana TaxID=516989 RepID=A0AAE0M7B9_9PEZI|nr:hypothetical protein B0H66DRAFT_177707 [Apodospora peruviana]